MLEAVIYVAILALLSALVINTILVMFSAYAQGRLERRLVLDAETALERISREIRLASGVNASSALGTDSSRLALNTVRSATDPTAAVKEFYISSGRLVIQQDSGPLEFLTSDKSAVTIFNLVKVTAAHSEAVKIVFTLEAESGRKQVSQTFYNTVVLRGSY